MATAAQDLSNTRSGRRKRVLMRGTIYTPEGAHVVWIRDVSKAGALISSDELLPSDCDVIFKRGPIFAAARIAWSNDSGAGLSFYRELAAFEVASASEPLPGRDG